LFFIATLTGNSTCPQPAGGEVSLKSALKLVKRCLKKVLGNAKLSYEELESVLIETEGVLNSRPLTYLYDELTKAPLTPSHLVIGHRLLDQSPVGTCEHTDQAKKIFGRTPRPLQESMEERISD